MLIFSKEMVYNPLLGQVTTTIDLDVERFSEGDNRTQYVFNQKLNFLSYEIERLEFTNDTSSVLKVQFGANNT